MATSFGHVTMETELIRLAKDAQAVLARCRNLQNVYFDTDMSSDVNALVGGTDKLPGLEMDKATILGMITVAQQFVNFMDGQAVSTNSYRITANNAANVRSINP